VLRHKVVRLLVACAFMIPLSLITAGSAAASCNPNRTADSQYYWVGSNWTISGTVAGASSQIWNYDPYVTGNGFSYAWAFLAGPGPSHAQIGNYKSATSRNVVIQVQNSVDGIQNINRPAKPVSTYSTYKVTVSTNSTWTFYVDGVSQFSQVRYWTPNNAEWAAETWQRSSQMMGGVSNKEYLAYNQVLLNGTWQNNTIAPAATTSGHDNPNNYFGVSGVPYIFQSWDKSCAS
jgi:hypothetical protein